jgi:hypothetical protein
MKIDLDLSDDENRIYTNELHAKLNPINKSKVKMENVNNPINEAPGSEYREIGIEETKDVVLFGTSLTIALTDSLKDGKIGVTDLANFSKPVLKMFSAISGINKVPAEVGNLSESEMKELIEVVKGDLKQLGDDKAALIVEKSLLVINDIYQLYKIAKG